MKKSLLFAGLAAATLLFAGCNKEADFKGLDATPFEIVLSEAQTRTVNDGMHTKWAENDKISLFHAETGTTDYKNDTPFVQEDNKSYPYTISDVENGVFQGTLMGGDLEEGKSYDWYVLYPFNSYLQSPVNTSDGRTYIGGRSDRAQVQDEYDSMAHLAGGSSSASFPLYGIATNVPASQTPTIAMKHVASVAAVTITNDSGSPIKISQVEFTAPEDIVGNFFISFEKEPLTLTPYTGQTSATAAVTVTNPADLAVGATATVYMGIKPFTAAAGDKLSLKITTSAGILEKELTLTGGVEFKAGKIKHLNVSYSSGTVVPTITIADIKEAITSTSNSSQSEFTGQLSGAVVSFVSGSNAFIQDETGGILYYKSGHGLAAGDVLSGVVTGKGYMYNGLKEITSLAGFEKTSGTAPDPVSMTLAELLADYDRYISVRVKVTGVTVSSAFVNRNTTMTDGEASLTLRDQKNGLTITAGQYDITGQPGYFNANQFGVWAQEDIVSSGDVNVFDVTERQISVDASATSAQINVTGNVEWTVDPDENIISVDPASGNGEGTVTVTFAANTDTEHAKEYTVFLRTEATGVEDEIEVTITQAKADPAGTGTATIDFSAQGFGNATEMEENPVTVNGVTASFSKGTGSTTPKYYTTGTAVRAYGGNTMTVSAPGKTISSIVITFGSNDGNNAITTDVPAFATNTWTGSSSTVVFTIGGTSGNRRIQKLVVTYTDGGTPAATLESISVTGAETEFTVGDTFTHNNAVVTATYSDNTNKVVTASAEFSSPDMSTAGTKTVTVTYSEGGVTKTADYDITVTAPVSGNTLSMTMTEYVTEHGCTVSAGADVTTYKTLYLSGSVRMSTSGEGTCGSFWVTSNTNSDKQWRLYQKQNGDVTITVAEGCELKSVKFTYTVTNTGTLKDGSGNQVASDAVKVVSGSSVTYTVGNTGSADNGQVRISAVEVVYTGEGTFPTDPDPVTTTVITMAGSQSVYVGETVSLNATSNVPGAPITYESEDTSIATVDANGVVTGVADGTVKVYARIAAVEGQYTAAERYCTVTVSTKPAQTEGTEVFVFSELGYSNGDEVTTVNGKDVTLVFAKGEGTNAPKYYTNGTNVRMYKSNTLTVSSGKTISKIEFFCSDGYGIHNEVTFSTGTCSNDVWTGSATSVVMTNATSGNTQVRMTSIKVTYE